MSLTFLVGILPPMVFFGTVSFRVICRGVRVAEQGKHAGIGWVSREIITLVQMGVGFGLVCFLFVWG